MADDDGAVGRVLGSDGLEGGLNPRAGFEPGEPEAVPGGAGGADVGSVQAGVEVGEPILEGVGAAEGEDGQVAGPVQGDVAGDVGPGRVLEFPDACDGLVALVGSFEEGAVVRGGTGYGGADVLVAGVVGAVGCCCVLGE